jgi:hypothetical protein
MTRQDSRYQRIGTEGHVVDSDIVLISAIAEFLESHSTKSSSGFDFVV